ncbi:hypothetical protein D3C81_1668350 [compost metagenome]
MRKQVEARLGQRRLQGHEGGAEQQQRPERGAAGAGARLGVGQQQPGAKRGQRGERQYAVEHVLPDAMVDQLGGKGRAQR